MTCNLNNRVMTIVQGVVLKLLSRVCLIEGVGDGSSIYIESPVVQLPLTLITRLKLVSPKSNQVAL